MEAVKSKDGKQIARQKQYFIAAEQSRQVVIQKVSKICYGHWPYIKGKENGRKTVYAVTAGTAEQWKKVSVVRMEGIWREEERSQWKETTNRHRYRGTETVAVKPQVFPAK